LSISSFPTHNQCKNLNDGIGIASVAHLGIVEAKGPNGTNIFFANKVIAVCDLIRSLHDLTEQRIATLLMLSFNCTIEPKLQEVPSGTQKHAEIRTETKHNKTRQKYHPAQTSNHQEQYTTNLNQNILRKLGP
jgi:hypothetical protein